VLAHVFTGLRQHTNGCSCPVVRLIRFSDKHMVDAVSRQASRNREKLCLVCHLENDGVGIFWKGATHRVVSRMNQLRGHGAKRKVSADQAVMIKSRVNLKYASYS
jgi:hypothetical protein